MMHDPLCFHRGKAKYHMARARNEARPGVRRTVVVSDSVSGNTELPGVAVVGTRGISSKIYPPPDYVRSRARGVMRDYYF